jgi:hypothetical protein
VSGGAKHTCLPNLVRLYVTYRLADTARETLSRTVGIEARKVLLAHLGFRGVLYVTTVDNVCGLRFCVRRNTQLDRCFHHLRQRESYFPPASGLESAIRIYPELLGRENLQGLI